MTRLVNALIAKGALMHDCVLTASVSIKNRYGGVAYSIKDYVLHDIKPNGEDYMLWLREEDGGAVINVDGSAITAIDGMSVDRYADVYDLNSDGSGKIVGKKRGRKPKIR